MLAVAGIAGGFWIWASHRPVAILQLADGMELRLIQEHYGRTLTDEKGSKTFDRIRRFVPTQIANFIPAYSQASMEGPRDRLWLVFTLRNSVTGKESRPDLQDFEVLDGQSAGRWQARCSPWGGARNALYSVVPLDTYPRRRKHLQVRFRLNGASYTMSVPNRHPVRDAPKWTAQPLPQTKRFGEREYILKKCAITQAPKNRQGSFSKWPEPFFGYFDTELEVRDHGAVTGGYAIMASFEDATGNSDSYSLPAGERVWRYRVSVQPQNLWKYHADDVWPLGSVSVPAAGQYQQLNLPAKAAERGIVAAAVLGPGGYVWQDGKCTTAVAMAPNSQGLNAVSVQADRRYRADLSPDHAVVMVIWFGRTPTDLLDIKFRVKSGEEPRELYREGGSGRWVSTPHPFAVEYYRLEARDTKLSANPFELEMVDARVDSVVFTIPAPDLPPPPR